MSIPSIIFGLTIECKLENVLSSVSTNEYGSVDMKHTEPKSFTMTIEDSLCTWGNRDFEYKATISEREIKCKRYEKVLNDVLSNGVVHHKRTYLNEVVVDRYSGTASFLRKTFTDWSSPDDERSDSWTLANSTYRCKKTDKKF